MACAQGSRSDLSYIVEVTKGTTPVGNFTNLPHTSHSLNLTKELVEGTDIQSHRMQVHSRHGNRQVGGDIVANLRNAEYDDLLEAAFLGTWTSDVLKIGTTPKYFTFEDYAADIDYARTFTGCTVSSLAISIAPNQMITATYTILGEDMIIGQTGATQNPSAGEVPFDSYSGELQIGDNGGALSTVGYVTGLDFTLENNITPTFTIGSATADCYSIGRAVVTGTMTILYENADMINRFLNETESAFSVSVDDPTGSNAYTFFFPRVKLNSSDAPVPGEELRQIELSFTALRDETEESNLVLTRPTSV